MKLRVKPMNRDRAKEIANWTYDAPFDFYNMVEDEETMNELVNGTYFQVLDQVDCLVGFCCFGESARVPRGVQYGAYPDNGSVDVGLGMRPDLTGRGLGHGFVSFVLAFGQSELAATSFRLTVAKFNERAIRLYRKLGFQPVMTFPVDQVEFITMRKPLD